MIPHLPPHCYSNKRIISDSLAIHYISLINADPERWDDPQRIWEFLFDLNLSRNSRQNSWKAPMGENRSYGSYKWLIAGTGERFKLVPDDHKTWHAGNSSYRGREDCNMFMDGVGLIAAPQVSNEYGFTEGHYRGTAELILEQGYGNRVTTHEFIRAEYLKRHPEDKETPEKKDPGPTWNWSRLREYINHDLDGG